METRPSIAIIGAGPAGLTLARILHLNGIRAEVFERDASPLHRPQGGTLDMHPDTGQHALRTARLWEAFLGYARFEDQGLRLYDKGGILGYAREGGWEDDRPEIDRGQLRDLLIHSLPADTIHWGKSLAAAPAMDGESMTLQFKDGTTHRCNLVIGADGAWSKVRPLVSDSMPAYSGATFYELEVQDADRRYPEVSALVGHGLMFALGDSKALIAQRNANAVIRVYAALHKGESWQATVDPNATPGQVKAGLASEFCGWDEGVLQLIYSAGGEMKPRPIYELPIGHRWVNRPGVTLLGDAAHLMSPFAGQGANLAMRDAADLSLALIGTSNWNAAIARFEEEMFARSEEAARQGAEGLRSALAEDALATTIADMERLFEPHEGSRT